MCGIVGLLSLGHSGISYKERQIFKELLMADVVRGSDGTGVFIVDSNKDIRVLKKELDPFNLFADKQWKNFFEPPWTSKKPDDFALIGHNRAASVGEINTANSHPHRSGHITLVHNGTVHGHSKLSTLKEVDVDSKAIADSIAEVGIEETIKQIYGSYSIIYFDSEEGTINIIRNDQRPLYFCPESGNSRIFIASEPLMLKWIMARNGVSPPDAIVSLKTDTLMTIPMEKTPGALPTPAFKHITGPKTNGSFRPYSWTNFVEQEVAEIVEPYLGTSNVVPFSKKQKKTERRILSTLGKQGMPGAMIDRLGDVKVGDSVVVEVVNYTESKNPDSPFVAIAESKLHPNTIFRFHVDSIEEIEKIMENPEQAITIRRILKFSEAKGSETQFIVWGTGHEPWPPNTEIDPLDMSQATKLESQGSLLDPGNPAHPLHKETAWVSPLDDRETPEERLANPDVVERLLH